MNVLGKRILRAALCALVLAMTLPASAHAYKQVRGMPGWPNGRATWYTVDRSYRDEMREVAAALNASGASVRLTESRSRRTARILVQRPTRALPCAGYARSGWSGSGRGARRTQSTITWGPCTPSGGGALAGEARKGTIRLLAHEVLHTYGLDHEQRRCSLMNEASTTTFEFFHPMRCGDTRRLIAGRTYCRILEDDDVRGLIARYGGRPAVLPGPTCPLQGPKPPTNISATAQAATATDSATITASWTWGAETGVNVTPIRGTCPTLATLPIQQLTAEGSASYQTGTTGGSTTFSVNAAGEYCLVIASVLGNQYYGPLVTAVVTVPA